ncbi:MAG TPA: PQQ-binding-like beta-propeller repeat protein [Planctomycetaceae bacterium]|nr:PQQ-binding-like beta-propeller repeat protein [Planctomycetaceae bacterium]
MQLSLRPTGLLALALVALAAPLVQTSGLQAPVERGSGADNHRSAQIAAATRTTGARDAPTPQPFETDWPRWRGPRGDGTWHGPPLPEDWPEGPLKTLWRKPVGGGYAGVIVAGQRVFVSDRQTAGREVERLLGFDAERGEPVWTFEYEVQYGDLDYGNGPRAAPTVADGRVYVLGALGDLNCLDAADGRVQWSTHLARDLRGRRPTWGYAASPLVVDDLVIVQPGAADGALAALDRRTGQPVWRSLADEAGYATPILIEHAGRPQLVAWTPQHVAALDPRTGQLAWSIPYEVTMGVSIATPVCHDGIVFVSGYWEGSKAIELGRTSDAARLLWEDNRHLRGLMSQPLVRDGHAYLLDKVYGLTCFELRTGKKLWDDGNRATPRGRNPQASLVALGDSGRVLVLNSDGELILARITPAGYDEQSRRKIVGETWAHPAYSGRRVYARSDTELVCVELPAP